MRAAQTTNVEGQRLVRVTLSDSVTLRRQFAASIPRWRRPLIGYFMSIPLVGMALLGTLILQYMLGHLYFPGTLIILAVLFTALIWGVGPALFSVALSTLVIDYFFVPPVGQFGFYNWQLGTYNWQSSLQLLPYVIAGLVIAVITGQRERAKFRYLATEQDLQTYADELEATNARLEEANRQLKDSNQLKDRFLSIASHELKTPITSIRGQAQLAIRRLSKQKEASPEIEGMRTTLEKINDQTSRLTNLIDELLDVSSIRAGKVELHKRECELIDLCRGVVEDQRLLTGRSILLDTSTATVLIADCERLAQVIVNLVSNAAKYSPDDTPIQVRVRQRDTAAVIAVEDHGKGIAKEQLPHIFDTFYRTPDAQASSKFGLGLGLAICKDIVERHGGRIWCESEVGRGSTFYVELPLR